MLKLCICLLLASATLTLAALTRDTRRVSSGSSRNHYSAGASSYSGEGPNAENVQILRHDQEINNDGSYRYAYETSNGIAASEQGIGGVSVQGSSSWISPEGVEIKTQYTADENGYHPVGDHIPKVPDYILRALEYIRTHPYQEKDYYTGQLKSPVTAAHKISTDISPPYKKSPSLSTTRKLNSSKYNAGAASRNNYNNKSIRKYRF